MLGPLSEDTPGESMLAGENTKSEEFNGNPSGDSDFPMKLQTPLNRNGNIRLRPDHHNGERDLYMETHEHESRVFPSFPHVRQKTLQSLYGIDKNMNCDLSLLRDKSPKGSVDEGIRSLVDLVNAHPAYATLSSCSGRISLFDPNHEAITSTSTSKSLTNEPSIGDNEGLDGNGNRIENYNEDENITDTGKGHGAWLISSHAKITTSQLMDALDEHNQSSGSHHALMFKHEPLLLHIAASNLARARLLLTLALNLGFRESGVVVTEKRITVAIRTHSLTLAVPISSGGRLRPNDEFLEELVREANSRFDLNVEKLIKLEANIESCLFRSVDPSPDISIKKQINHQSATFANPLDFVANCLPDLRLWGHTAVVIPTSEQNDDVDVIVLGGQGIGPTVARSGKKQSPKRSDKVFRLRRRGGQWGETWCEMNQNVMSHQLNSTQTNCIEGTHIEIKRMSFTTRIGSSSCLLPQNFGSTGGSTSSYITAIFGGRTSPAKPYNDLILMICKSGDASFFEPVNIRGDIPSPRWGHTLTALSGHGNRLAILTGGRDDNGLTSSVYILSYEFDTKDDGSKTIVFVWQCLPYSIPRFYHCACNISMSDQSTSNDKILVFGGLNSLALASGDATSNVKQERQESDREDQSQSNYIITIGEEISFQQWDGQKGIAPRSFGSSLASFSIRCKDETTCTPLVLVSGGLPCASSSRNNPENPALHLLQYSEQVDSKPLATSVDFKVCMNKPNAAKEAPAFGSTLVHHCCIALPSHKSKSSSSSDGRCLADFVLLGGGFQLFAFGQAFAPTYHVQMKYRQEEEHEIHPITPSFMSNSSEDNISSHTSSVTGIPTSKAPKVRANGRKANETDVICLECRSAKEVKTALEQVSYLDRNYRMTKAIASLHADQPDIKCIAIPITKECEYKLSHGLFNPSWKELVIGRGRQEMPFSTAVLGRS